MCGDVEVDFHIPNFIFKGEKVAGICVLCNNLSGDKLNLNDELFEVCHCIQGKFDKDGIKGYFTQKQTLKPCKSVAEIQDKCDKWDDRLKPKKVE
jgi:hypothetical protein